MKELEKALVNLLKIKSLMTLMLTGVFCYLACKTLVASKDFVTIYMMVTAFYFGTQIEKKKEAA